MRERLLAERKPHVIIETHSEDLDAACRWLLTDHGYDIEAVEPRRWIARSAYPCVQPLVRRPGPHRGTQLALDQLSPTIENMTNGSSS